MKNDITKKHELNIAVDKYLKITDFFQSIISVAQGKTLLSIISNSTAATNLFKNLFDSAGEAFSIVKFVLVLISKYTNFKDKNLQCLLLCTLAYEYALLKTIKDNPDIIINIDENKISKFKSSLLRKNEISIDIDTFDFQCALSSSFIKEADKMTQDFFNSININEQEQRVLINSIHTNFLKGLCELKSDSSINIKFNALFKYLEAKPSLLKSKVLLLEYANYQRWVFKEKKLFNEKEFSLSDIYVALRCYENIFENGKEIYNSKYTNCITDIAKKILHYIKHEDFNSFIAINGTAGAGKSSFTLSFCDKLLEHGFIPIRIPFKHIKFDINKTYFNDKEIYNILNASINFKDISCYGDNWPQVPNNLFCNGEIFDERIPVGEKYMSPYIIILDGWDELNTEIQNKLKYFLEGLYNTFIDNKNNIIRVIITGRPSDNVCTYLRNIKKETPILTTCQLNFDEFKLLLDKLNYFNNLTETYMRKLVGKFESYKYYYFEDCEEEQDDIFDILKSPLIVFIIHELLTNCNNDFEIDSLFSNKSLLYKKLADITCENAGKRKEAESDKVNSKLYGDKLRDTLNKTAAIISIKGKELVSFKDLKLLLDSDELNITEDDISKIVVSYYFKGKHYNAGCEFIHKSFREFFYAEAIFNTLIKYNNFYSSYTYKNVPYENNKNDFRKTSNLYNFSRSLCPLISTKYLSKEETELFEGLLISYISRKHDQNNNYQIIIFDALISLWKWFISGKPLKYELSEDGMDKNPSLYEINKKILKLLSSELRDLNVLYGILGYNLLTLICIYNKVILNQKQIKNLKDDKNH